MQDLNQGVLEAGDLKPILDPTDEEHRVNPSSDVLEKAADEACSKGERSVRSCLVPAKWIENERGLFSE